VNALVNPSVHRRLVAVHISDEAAVRAGLLCAVTWRVEALELVVSIGRQPPRRHKGITISPVLDSGIVKPRA
jgi:hypothetical protein